MQKNNNFLIIFAVIICIFLIFFLSCEKRKKGPAHENIQQEKVVTEESEEYWESFKSNTDTIRIGVIFAKTGIAAADNLQNWRITRFTVNEINKKDGVLGKKIELLEYDNHSTPIQSQIAAEQAVKDDVIAVIGASWSSHSIAMAPVLQQAGIPMISPRSTNPEVTKIGNYIFRAIFTDTVQGEYLARFVHEEFDAKTAVMVVDITSAYSKGLAEVFHSHFEGFGGKILLVLEYKTDREDFIELLEQVKEVAPDVLFVPGHDESGYIVRDAQNLGINAIYIGGDGWSFESFFAKGGKELKQGFFSYHWPYGKFIDDYSEETRKAIETCQQQYGHYRGRHILV